MVTSPQSTEFVILFIVIFIAWIFSTSKDGDEDQKKGDDMLRYKSEGTYFPDEHGKPVAYTAPLLSPVPIENKGEGEKIELIEQKCDICGKKFIRISKESPTKLRRVSLEINVAPEDCWGEHWSDKSKNACADCYGKLLDIFSNTPQSEITEASDGVESIFRSLSKK